MKETACLTIEVFKKKLIYICSPCAGDIGRNIQKARKYCRRMLELCPDVVPIAPHVYCTQFLDDNNPVERAAGLNVGLVLLEKCDALWAFGLQSPSAGMRREIEYAGTLGIPVEDGMKILSIE